MTRITLIYADVTYNRISAYPCHPCNQRSNFTHNS